MKSTKKNIILNNLSITRTEKIFFFILLSNIILSCFFTIPTDQTSIGVSSEVLDIGDRAFYIDTKGFEIHSSYNGNFLYPKILSLITKFSLLIGYDSETKFWNLITISLTSIIALIVLRLLRISSLKLFDEKVAKITSILFIANPYTYFYSLSGGITNYVILGVTFVLYASTFLNEKSITTNGKNSLLLASGISVACCYLSALRPSGSLFSISFLGLLIFLYIRKSFRNNNGKFVFLPIVLFTSSIFYSIFNIFETLEYVAISINHIQNEGGYFFGYSRDLLREKISLINEGIFSKIISFIYISVWKITDFISGISDIRDTHNASSMGKALFPFIARTFLGLFFLFPINLFSFIGVLSNFKKILEKQIWIILLSSFIAISPAIIGVGMSRYWIMFYTPYLIFASKIISDIKDIYNMNRSSH